MFAFPWRSLLAAFPLAFLVGCITTVETNDGGGNGTVRVTLQATYEKQNLTTSGYGSVVTAPARYAYAEIRQVSNNSLLAGGYLGSDGTGYADIPAGSNAYARIFAAYEVPVTSGSGFFQRGSVVNEPYYSGKAFDQTSDWYVDSSSFTANSSGTLAVKALTSNRIAGAFNIADQAVSLALKLRELEPTLRLPNLHTYWTTSSNWNDHYRTYPRVLKSGNAVVKTSSGRAIFTHAVYGLQGGGPDTEQDEWDDSALAETMAHLLFANHSYQPDGGTLPIPLLRMDNENGGVNRYTPTEPSISFAGGFCDFLAAASLGNQVLLDSYRNGSGAFVVEAFDLGSHSQVQAADRTEFTRGSIAVTLWGIWKNALGGGSPGLSTLWTSVRSYSAFADGTGEFGGSSLACYPTYLTGLKARSASSWSAIVQQLALESIPEPNNAYFSSSDLWTTVSVPSGTQSGSLRCYPTNQYRFYDYGPWWPNFTQSLNYRFTLTSPRAVTVTMTPLDGQDFELNVLDSKGWLASSFDPPFGNIRSLNLGTLPAGTYVVRVRVNPDAPSSNGTYRFNLSIQ